MCIRQIEMKTEYYTRGFIKPLTLFEDTVKWQDVTDVGISVRLTMDKPEFIEYIYAEIDGSGDVFLMDAEETIGVLRAGEHIMTVNKRVRQAQLYISTDFKDVHISRLEAYAPEHFILPQPYEYSKTAGELDISCGASISCGAEELSGAAEFLSSELTEGGVPVNIIKDGALSAEEFLIDVDIAGISVRCGGIKSAWYAADVILQLKEAGKISCCHIHDKPFMKIRGFHAGLPSEENFEFYKRFIKYVLVPMRYNVLFIQPTSAIEYDCYPEINRMWEKVCERYRRGLGEKPFHYDMLACGGVLKKSRVRELVEYARSFGIEVIPEIQSLSHTQYITRAFPEVGESLEQSFTNDEINTNLTDERPESGVSHCCCPSNPKSYEILFNIIDEVLEVFAPVKYVHIGHDEGYEIGVCPKCRAKAPAQLFYDDVMKLYEYLKPKGVKIMMWSDMLQPSADYETKAALKKLPKDIILLEFIWYFHMEEDIEKALINEGFSVMLGNMNSSHFPRFEERRGAVLGAETSTWIEISERSFAHEGKFFEAVYSAEMMWSEHYRGELRDFYALCAARRLLGVRRRLHSDTGGAPVHIELPSGELSKQSKLVLLETGMKTACESDVTVELGEYADKLLFVHAADKAEKRIVWENLCEIGRYVVVYEDGVREEAPIYYGGNIRVWNKKYARPKGQAYYRHQGYVGTYECYPYKTGKTDEGADYTIYGYEWYNPRPDKKLAYIQKIKSENTDVNTLLFEIQAIKG